MKIAKEKPPRAEPPQTAGVVLYSKFTHHILYIGNWKMLDRGDEWMDMMKRPKGVDISVLQKHKDSMLV